ncbi:MAG: GerMN domain-containing protein [Ilumatobacteraceae bacterium]
MSSRRRKRLIVTLTIGLVLTSCGISNDTDPRPIGEADRGVLVAPAAQPVSTSTGSDRIYLLAPEASGGNRLLRSSTRDVGDSVTQRLTSLFGALTIAETDARLRTAIPEGLQLRAAIVQADGTAVVDVTDELLALSRSSLVDAVAQIVFTTSEVPGVRSVELRVSGQNLQWPTGDGELQGTPLSVYDYPGFVQSTQPDFPAVPSPVEG